MAKLTPHPIGIGSTVFVRNDNYRVYRRSVKDGCSTGGPVEVGYWHAATITGETPRLWLTGGMVKVPKAGELPSNLALTWADVRRRVWAASVGYKIIRELENRVRRGDEAALIAVGEVLGMPGPDDMPFVSGPIKDSHNPNAELDAAGMTG